MRRTQQERRAATRLRLLDAAVEELVKTGYARFTTSEVVRSAELSQGALFKHFPTKMDLVVAATEHLLGLTIEDYRRLFAEAGSEENRLESALRVLFFMLKTPRVQTAIELLLSARTDRELRRLLAPLASAHRAKLRAIARELFPAQNERPDFDRHALLVFNALQGEALRYMVDSESSGEDPVPYIVDLTHRLFQR